MSANRFLQRNVLIWFHCTGYSTSTRHTSGLVSVSVCTVLRKLSMSGDVCALVTGHLLGLHGNESVLGRGFFAPDGFHSEGTVAKSSMST